MLTWAVTPLDLDLWLVSADNPATATYWDNTGPNDGVRLDKDDTDGYGPEVITLTDTTAAGDYRVAVNVYTSNGEMDCELQSNDICRFAGLETVSFYGSFTPPESGAPTFSGLIARSIMPRAKVVQENSTTYSQASGLSCPRRAGPPLCVYVCLSFFPSVCPRVCVCVCARARLSCVYCFIHIYCVQQPTHGGWRASSRATPVAPPPSTRAPLPRRERLRRKISTPPAAQSAPPLGAPSALANIAIPISGVRVIAATVSSTQEGTRAGLPSTKRPPRKSSKRCRRPRVGRFGCRRLKPCARACV